ncbi:hypothetical protein L596_023142 [Steinernema carpocapsae]|uniref:Uncharacterized protein n=1 Tax=Steinernema carpocapsae TaxID=34508 RepID=A0A4U5MCR7_STECR|nr:hypothetical protein L596_023142 [Steinernema carpocapsae]
MTTVFEAFKKHDASDKDVTIIRGNVAIIKEKFKALSSNAKEGMKTWASASKLWNPEDALQGINVPVKELEVYTERIVAATEAREEFFDFFSSMSSATTTEVNNRKKITTTKKIPTNRIRTSDLRISDEHYSPPLYQLSYGWIQLWDAVEAT